MILNPDPTLFKKKKTDKEPNKHPDLTLTPECLDKIYSPSEKLDPDPTKITGSESTTPPIARIHGFKYARNALIHILTARGVHQYICVTWFIQN